MIRKATREDIPAIIELSKDFAHEIGLGDEWNRKAAAALIDRMIVAGVCLVDDKDKIVGVIGGILAVSLWNPHKTVLEEQIYYVTPDDRFTSTGLKLIKAYAKEAEGKDLTASTLKLMFNSPAIDKHYAKLGYEKLETTYMRRF